MTLSLHFVKFSLMLTADIMLQSDVFLCQLRKLFWQDGCVFLKMILLFAMVSFATVTGAVPKVCCSCFRNDSQIRNLINLNATRSNLTSCLSRDALITNCWNYCCLQLVNQLTSGATGVQTILRLLLVFICVYQHVKSQCSHRLIVDIWIVLWIRSEAIIGSVRWRCETSICCRILLASTGITRVVRWRFAARRCLGEFVDHKLCKVC